MKVAITTCVMGVAVLAAGTEPKTKLPNSRADLANGEKLFQVQCARCHGPKGIGGRGPALTRAKLLHAPDDGALIKVLEDGIRGSEMPGAGAMSEREVRQTAAYVRSLGKVAIKPVPGDAAHGAEIYRGKGCAGCHGVHAEGGIEGPDLAGIGDGRSAAYLRESIVDPSASVPEGYLLVTVVPKEGERVTGVRVNEDSFSIQVRDRTGRTLTFWKAEVQQIEKQRGKSGMPSYRGQLSEAELTDLVAYLASLKEEK
ncbi:MAG TPA: c-type cytochrome [Bryobacteraceae bacterium]|nr:c-type cytochrome [Bryobacteraceae bacterium]